MDAGEAIELRLALVLEAEVTGAVGELLDDGVGEDLTAAGSSAIRAAQTMLLP